MLNSIYTEKLPLLLAFWAELSMKGPRFDSFGQTLFLPFCTWQDCVLTLVLGRTMFLPFCTWQDFLLPLYLYRTLFLPFCTCQDLVKTAITNAAVEENQPETREGKKYICHLSVITR